MAYTVPVEKRSLFHLRVFPVEAASTPTPRSDGDGMNTPGLSLHSLTFSCVREEADFLDSGKAAIHWATFHSEYVSYVKAASQGSAFSGPAEIGHLSHVSLTPGQVSPAKRRVAGSPCLASPLKFPRCLGFWIYWILPSCQSSWHSVTHLMKKRG